MPTRAQRNAREDPSPLLELPSPRRNRVSRPPMPSISDPGDESVADIPLSDIPSRGPRDSPHNPFRSSSASQATARPSASREPEDDELLGRHVPQHSRQGSDAREDVDEDEVFSPAVADAPLGSRQQRSSDVLELAEAIMSLSRKGKSSTSTSTKIRKPDPFDGSDPEKLRTFLVQLNLVFRAEPDSFKYDRDKVNYAVSYLKGTALEWFEPDLLKEGLHEPAWCSDWDEFKQILEDNFGVYDPIGDAEMKLSVLRMQEDKPCATYLTEFQKLAAQVDWGDAALRHRLYMGLPNRLKNKISEVGKPTSLSGMRRLIQTLDHRYWERQEEIKRERRAEKAPHHSGSSSSSSGNKHSHSGKSSGHGGSSGNRSGSGNSGSSGQGNSSGKNNNSSSSSSSSKPKSNSSGGKPNNPTLDGKLGKDGKLTPEERQRHMDNNLCLVCGSKDHHARDCPRSSNKVKARAAKTSDSASAEPEKSKA